MNPLRGTIVFILAVSFFCLSCRKDDFQGVTLRYMAWGNPEQLALEKEFCQKFDEKHPGIRVKFFQVPSSSYGDKLKIMLASGTAPDVMRVDHYDFPALASKKFFAPLEPLIQADTSGFSLDDYMPFALEEGFHQGTLYGLNVLAGSIQIYYNKTAFQKAGLADPYELWQQGKWDSAAFLDACQRLTLKDETGRVEQFGCLIPPLPLICTWFYAYGGSALSEDMTRCTMDSPACREVLKWFYDWRWTYHITPTPAEESMSAFTFQSGRLGMVFGWAGEAPRFRRQITDFEWDVTVLPAGPQGSPAPLKGNQLVIFHKSPHPKEAWEFLKYMTSSEVEMELCVKRRRALPTRKSVLYSEEYLKAMEPPFHNDVFIASAQMGHPVPINERWAEWTMAFNSELQRLWINEATVDEVVPEIQRQVNKILSEEPY